MTKFIQALNKFLKIANGIALIADFYVYISLIIDEL